MHLGLERLALVGPSWGATLALVYAVAHPGQVDRLVLVGMGPISDELDAVTRAILLKPLSVAERDERASLRHQVLRRRWARATRPVCAPYVRGKRP